MHPILRNVIAVIIGLFAGGTINMLLVELGNSVVPIEGVDVSNMEDLERAMVTFTPINFLFPFLAHALGTLFGAFVATLIAGTHKMKFALAVGCFFLLGGITMSYLLPAPMWFKVLDLAVAYIPMAWLGGKIATRTSK